MNFSYASTIRQRFPSLTTQSILVHGIDAKTSTVEHSAALWRLAAKRLESGDERGFAEIAAWRQAFAQMGLKPTQYRCAAEALLRRFRKEGLLPQIHPLIDLCNAVSIAHAIPIAVFDIDRIEGRQLCVRPANGSEIYHAFDGSIEQPHVGEIIYVDEAGQAHSRRWCNRQSAVSAVRNSTSTALIVAEALHPQAPQDLLRLLAVLKTSLTDVWPQTDIAEVKVA
ncbi:B3/B4 domain-containing protein [Paludibacterium yongneupense]|uniref:B3/B4 domain-containing protein n=1 Tax=Paludibacterium yongneupense TaxID=400061 RepID=UPI00048DFB1F|nr:phenylalanine--tRNA ligase beta subunit-related protein [Paludibacterium yongneupense]